MSNGEYAQVIKLEDTRPGEPPRDITAEVRAVRSDATSRILTRVENAADPEGGPAEPLFFSVTRTCTHTGCNVLKGAPQWRVVDQPWYYSMVDPDGVVHAVIECPCHGSRFDVVTGKRLRGPAPPDGPLARFATKIEKVDEEDWVFVALDPEPEEAGPIS